jgi:hypothetical protein
MRHRSLFLIRYVLAGLVAAIAVPTVMGTAAAIAAITKTQLPAPHHLPTPKPKSPKPVGHKPAPHGTHAPKATPPKATPPKAPAGKASRITKAVALVNPMQAKYLKHDITGDGRNETFCNWFVMDVGKALGYPRAIPSNGQSRGAGWSENPVKPLSANQLNKYFKTSADWTRVTPAEAAQRANKGEFVVGSLVAPGNGHVAVVIPGSTANNIRVAQAGSTNSTNMPADTGFAYYVYTGK